MSKILISLYVNNLLLFVKNLSIIDNVKQLLKKHFKIKNLDKFNIILDI